MDQKLIDEIRARCDNATNGEWYRVGERKVNSLPGFYPILIAETAQGVRGDADAEFITHARQDIPALLDEIDSLKAERDAAVADLTEAGYCFSCSKNSTDFCPYQREEYRELGMLDIIDFETRLGCYEWRGII